MGDANNERLQNELRKRQKAKAEQWEQDIRTVMRTAAGRRFAWHIINNMAGLWGVYLGNNANDAFHNEGKRDVGQTLMRELQRVSCSDSVHMTIEAVSEQNEDKLQGDIAKGAAKTEPDEDA